MLNVFSNIQCIFWVFISYLLMHLQKMPTDLRIEFEHNLLMLTLIFFFLKIKPPTFPLSQPRASAEVWATTIRQEPVMLSRKPMCVSGVRTVSGQEADAGPKRQVNWSGSSPCVFCSSTGVVNWPCRLWPGLLHRWPDSANPAVSSENVSTRGSSLSGAQCRRLYSPFAGTRKGKAFS